MQALATGAHLNIDSLALEIQFLRAETTFKCLTALI